MATDSDIQIMLAQIKTLRGQVLNLVAALLLNTAVKDVPSIAALQKIQTELQKDFALYD